MKIYKYNVEYNYEKVRNKKIKWLNQGENWQPNEIYVVCILVRQAAAAVSFAGE